MTFKQVFATIFRWGGGCAALVTSILKGIFTLVVVLCILFAQWLFVPFIRFFDKHRGSITAFATVVIAAATLVYVVYTERLWETTQNALVIGQQAYVTIGRKDGVVAEFVSPKDAKDNAGIVIYFQNSGHIPAKCNWGTISDILLIPPVQDFPPIHSPHHFTAMTRTRNTDNPESVGESGGITIAGDSLYTTDVSELPQSNVARLATMNRVFELMGAFEYCDEFGTYSCRQFTMYYQGVPYNAFRMVSDYACWLPLRAVKPDPHLEYLFPCKTREELHKEQETAAEKQKKGFPLLIPSDRGQ
jgi:hypothetical protein